MAAIILVLGEFKRSSKDKKVVDTTSVKDPQGVVLEERLQQLHVEYAKNEDIDELFGNEAQF